MKYKLLKTMFLSCVLLIMFCTSAFASTGAVLLDSKETVIDGQKVIVNTYDDNGYIVQTFKWPDATCGIESKLSEQEMDTFIDANYPAVIQEYAEEIDLYSGPISFDKRAQSSQNAYCAVRTVGDFYATCLLPPFKTKVVGGYLRGYYGGPTTATKITLTETYNFSGIDVTVSWPPGVSVTGSSHTWTSDSYDDTNMATAHREDIEGQSILADCTLGINSRADIYLGNVSYSAVANVSCKTKDFVE